MATTDKIVNPDGTSTIVTPADRGNPNVFTTFKGRYLLVASAGQVVDTNVVMLSCTNDVQPIGDWTLSNYVANSPFATLPVECRPQKIVKIPVVVNDGTERIVVMTVNPDGTMTLPFNYSAASLFLSGINFNISDNWY